MEIFGCPWRVSRWFGVRGKGRRLQPMQRKRCLFHLQRWNLRAALGSNQWQLRPAEMDHHALYMVFGKQAVLWRRNPLDNAIMLHDGIRPVSDQRVFIGRPITLKPYPRKWERMTILDHLTAYYHILRIRHKEWRSQNGNRSKH